MYYKTYYGPLDPGPVDDLIGDCECGQSEEDCDGGCYPNSLLQLTDPVTGEHPLPLGSEDYEDPRISAIEAERASWGHIL